MRDRKKYKVVSLAVAAALITGMAGYAAGAGSVTNLKEVQLQELSAEAGMEVSGTADVSLSRASDEASGETAMESIIDNKAEAGKEETVYVLASADGTINKVIVSDWLKNPKNLDQLEDISELDNIENVKGYESYTINPDNMTIWDAGGNDIYYQGTTNKALPVDVKISYKLDGRAVSATELAGKSGRVTIRFDYKNNESQTVLINGEKETVYVPFVMVTGMVVDDSKFTNITVSNGKIINDGDKSIVMAYALPGLQESLALSEEKLAIPDYVEITADVKDFSMATTITLATNDVFNSLNLDDISTLEDLQASLDTLSDSSLALVDGSSALYDGIKLLVTKSQTLVSGVNDLHTGAGAVNTGASQISTGAAQISTGAQALDAGIVQLNQGLAALSGSSQDLRDGAAQVFDSLLAAADSQLAAAGLSVPKLTIENYKETLSGVLGSLNSDAVYSMAYNTALSQVTDAVNAGRPTIRAEVEKAVRAQVLQGVLDSQGLGMTSADYEAAVSAGLVDDATRTAIDGAVDATVAGADMQAVIDANTEAKVQSLINDNMASSDVTTKINAAVAEAQSGAGSIQALIAQLDSYKAFYDGVVTYTQGVDTAYSGSNQLVSGSAELNAGAQNLSTGASTLTEGTNTLYSGMETLKDGTAALVSGENELSDGSEQLLNGMKEFNEKGIQKLVEAFDGDVEVLIARIKAVVDVSKEYQTFAGKADDVRGSVKFIYRTDSIE
ncbi:MAG: hypothetical protein NC428_02760 [Clostridium sp.]|nr:hypothetical protein [Clostridium sp.]